MALAIVGNKIMCLPHVTVGRLAMGDSEESMDLFEENTPPEQVEGEQQVEGELSQHITPKETRLMISKIVCRDFKSYAGVKELGPFHKVNG